jgi:hypothetical protein
VPFPNVIRFASGGDIVVGEVVSNAVRRIHLGSSTITRVACFSNYLGDGGGGGSQQWIWLDVDTAGMCGPVDDIWVFKVQDAINGAHWTWRMSLDGSYSTILFNDGWALPTYGPTEEVVGGPGHYPWAIAISKHEGRWIATGLAHFQPVMGRIKQSGDPVVDHNFGINFNEAILESGSQIHYSGSAPGFPREVRPSFWTLRGSTGAGWATNLPGANTFEDLMCISSDLT